MSDSKSTEELRDKLKHIARFKFGPFKNTVPAYVLLMPADNDHKSNGVGMQYSYDAFIDEVAELFDQELAKRVEETNNNLDLILYRLLGVVDSVKMPLGGGYAREEMRKAVIKAKDELSATLNNQTKEPK